MLRRITGVGRRIRTEMDGTLSDKSFPRIGLGRLKAGYREGRLVELQDSSRWEVLPGHEVFTAHWAPETKVTVVPGDVADYPYDLINTESGERVPARYRGSSGPTTGWKLIDH